VTDGLEEKLRAELAPEFEILRRLGQGSMSRVFVARETGLGRLVAVKVLSPQLNLDEVARKRFEREGRSAAKISHRNVTSMYRVGSLTDGTPFLVMEYVEGRNLSDLLQATGPMDVERARHVLEQVAEALKAAHEKGIVHRDLKGANVIQEEGTDRVVLTDFGVAGVLESGSANVTRLTQQGQVLGDPRFMAPEQLLGEPTVPESDIYSLGVLGYHLLTGDGPYEAKSQAQLLTAHIQQEPRPLASLRAGVPQYLQDLLTHCLNKQPTHRPRAADVIRILQRGEAGAGEAGGVPPGPLPGVRGFLAELKRRHVYNVGAAYIVGSFLVLEGAGNILPTLPLPEGTYTVLVAVVLAMFPVVLVLSWMYDITSSGIRRTAQSDPSHGRGPMRVMQAAGLLLSLAMAALIGWWVLRGG
jgi:predicted Ser/Thr protein kinase